MSRARNYGRCPHCGRTVLTASARPRSTNGVVVHHRCYRLLTDPCSQNSPAATTPASALPTTPAA